MTKLIFTPKAFYIFALIGLVSCQSEPQNRRDLLPSYIGLAGEILVVMDKNYWDSEAGKLVRNKIYSPIPGMPQAEVSFDIAHTDPEFFDRFNKPHRNILFIEIQDNINYKVPVTKVVKEKYSKDQIIVEMYAKSEQAFMEEFSLKWDQLADRFNRAEVERIVNYNLQFGPTAVADEVNKHLNVTATFLENSSVNALEPGFFWAHKISARTKDGQTHDIQQGVVIYDFPYTSDSTFTTKYLLHKRDSVLKENLPGPADGSYMQTEFIFDPVNREIELDGAYAFEIRGLWRMENVFMGGPFISVARVDEKRGRIVVAEGFVFAPKFDKREYLRDVEAAIKSLKIN